MISIKNTYKKNKTTIPIIIGILVILFILFFRLSSIVGGMNSLEIATVNNAKDIAVIVNNGLNEPYNLLQFGVNKVLPSSIFSHRAVSVLLTIPLIIFFFIHLKHKYGKYTAPMVTVLFASSAWLLHSSRSSVPTFLYISILGILWFHSYIRSSMNYNRIYLLGILLISFLIYIPGIIWFILIGIVYERKILKALIKKLNRQNIIVMSLIGLLLIIPLLYGLVKTPGNIVNFLGLPSSSPNLLTSVKLFVEIPYNLFIKMPYSPMIWLGTVPLLDYFSSAMFIVGGYQLIKNWKNDYSKMIIISFILGSILYALNGPVNMVIILPSTYLIIASGLAHIIDIWFRVFPKNPIPRYVGLTILSIAVLAVFTYQTRSYFVAWPNSSGTKSYYRHYPS